MNESGKKKILVGTVTSDKMDKTRVVIVERLVRHRLYEKVFKKRKKFYFHDEKNQSHIGDKVKIVETRPLSKLKRWRLLEITSQKQN